ncbi:phosphate/phosphite/phosphonate ABC transporter substrate-binding protein [Microbacterium sp. A82]|uniref:phosphate/phosphite/phosphonate ABC transporter substrate-binding protein n=1 Tax=Microbacterium sp. A82 TaxID=3450452 RepID=UPI003F2F37EB
MSKRILTTVAAGALVLATTLLTGCGPSAAGDEATPAEDGAWPEKIVISQIPTEDQTELDIESSLAFEILERELGIPIEFHMATSYAATIEAQRAGKVDIARYGAFSYVLAKDSGVNIDILGAQASTADGELGYYSVASVAAGSDITSLEDAAGKTVCFVDPASTSGYLFPSAGLIEAGIDPEVDITPIFAGGHDASVLALVDGQCDIAFSTEGMATKQLIESGQVTGGQLTQIWESELITPTLATVSSELPADLVEKIKAIYLEQLNVPALTASGECDTSDPDEKCGIGVYSYEPIEDADYDGVRKVCEVTKSEACDITNQ